MVVSDAPNNKKLMVGCFDKETLENHVYMTTNITTEGIMDLVSKIRFDAEGTHSTLTFKLAARMIQRIFSEILYG